MTFFCFYKLYVADKFNTLKFAFHQWYIVNNSYMYHLQVIGTNFVDAETPKHAKRQVNI